jgi:radical SAM superfamily enzyme YgiQ (UPF0313 family)
MYAGKRFRIKSSDEICAAIDHVALRYPNKRRLFLCDGDALIIPQARLVAILEEIRRRHPRISRVATYANAKAIARKSEAQLRELRQLGLKMLHVGLESGDDATLAAMGKRGDSTFIVEQGRRARAAGLKVFVTVLVGVAGTERSQEHAKQTGLALTRMAPNYVGALTLMLVPGTLLHARWEAGEFELPDASGMLRELRTMLAHTELDPGIFFANHASNYLPIQAVLPHDKPEVLRWLDHAIAGSVPLKPEVLRGL